MTVALQFRQRSAVASTEVGVQLQAFGVKLHAPISTTNW